jgi:histidyl-tRNA synthetase
MKNIIPPVKGTRDFYPEQMALRSWLYNTVRSVSETFGYQEWDAPFLETLDLYAAKSGDELVKKQSYVFTDRGGDEITLRPELTPSLARMVAARQNEMTFPARWCLSVRSGGTKDPDAAARVSFFSGTLTCWE